MRKLFSGIMMILFVYPISSIMSEPVETVLQQGLDGYSGCSDAYILNTGSTENFGADTLLYAEYVGC